MADGSLQIELTGTLADEVRAAAAACGLSPEDYVRQQLEADLALDDDESWEEDVRRLEEPGENIPLDKAFEEFRAHVAELRNKAK